MKPCAVCESPECYGHTPGELEMWERVKRSKKESAAAWRLKTVAEQEVTELKRKYWAAVNCIRFYAMTEIEFQKSAALAADKGYTARKFLATWDVPE